MSNLFQSVPFAVVLLIIGFVFLVKGADAFVEGCSSIARRYHVPSLIIGMTIVAMGTSLPETAVSVTAAVTGNNALAVSNAVGSNIFNLMVVVGACTLFTSVAVQINTLKIDFPISILCAVLLLILGAAGMSLGHIDGVVFIILFLAFIFPFIMVIINAFKTKGDITADPLALVGSHGFILTNFTDAMKKMNFATSFTNSLIITTTSTILTIVLAAMTAFVIVRNNWKVCALLFSAMIASMVIPFQVLMIPLVSLYGGILGILNSRVTLIFMHVGFSLSMATFMFHGAIHTSIPMELEEAAYIDGCNRWQTYWKIVFPLLKPTIATVAIIDAMAFWNDYLLPSLVLARKELYTLPIATQAFYGTYSTDLGLVMAALLLAMLPILVLYLFLQRYIVEGVTSGAVKG